MTDAVKIPGALRTCVEGFVLVRKAPLLRCGLTRDLKVEGKGKSIPGGGNGMSKGPVVGGHGGSPA